MKNYYNQIILILREKGMTKVGQVGKEILAHMVLEKVNNPYATYQQICEAVEAKKIVKHMDVSIQRKDIISRCEKLSEDKLAKLSKNEIASLTQAERFGLSDEECAALFVIEGIETHDYDDDGKKVVQDYVETVYREFQRNIKYEEILEKVRELGLTPDNDGVNLMLSMAYKCRICPEISEKELYTYLMEKCSPSEVMEEIERNGKIPAEIVSGSNIQQEPQRKKSDITKEGIDTLIMQNAKQSEVLAAQPDVKGVISVILEGF